MFASLIIILAYFFLCLNGLQIQSNSVNKSNINNITNHCIGELEAIIAEPFKLNLANPSKISPNYSVATSVSYSNSTSTILIAGDFFYIDAKNASNRTYYSFFQGFSHTKDNKFDLKYSKYGAYNNPTFGNKYIQHKSLRSWTRIIAHPYLEYFYVFGINNLTQYNASNGAFMWTANIPPCSTKKEHHNQPIIYTDATFFKSDKNNLYIGGNCVAPSNKTVIVLDEYSIPNGAHNSTFRQLYNLTQLGFFKEIKYLDAYGVIPPEVTLSAPVNESLKSTVVDKYFYVGFTHLLFSGVARIERDIISGTWRVNKWPEHWTLVNPSFISHRTIATSMKENALISLLDPSLNGLINLFLGKMRHLKRWDTVLKLGQLDEKPVYDTFTWYGGHLKHDLHFDWTLSIDALSNYSHIYITTSPLLEDVADLNHSTIAKHNVSTGEIIAGANVPFYALDSIVTNDNQLITVGFEWMGLGLNLHINASHFQRRAVFGVYNNEIRNASSCIGCEMDYYGDQCGQQCLCNNGYCNDSIGGDGYCYCTLLSFGATCMACDGLGGSCSPLKGICNSGPDGDGKCKFCYDLEIDIEDNMTNSSFDFGLGSKYGPDCDLECSCSSDNGICYTTGDLEKANAGKCLYCTDKKFYGENCDNECECNHNTEYCSNGVKGDGCVKYDYGGLLKDKGVAFYAVIASALFVVFFTITWWQTNRQYKKEHDGQSIPWCPQKEESEAPILKNKSNDLEENMINKNLQNDAIASQQPVVSHMIGNNEAVVDNEKFNI